MQIADQAARQILSCWEKNDVLDIFPPGSRPTDLVQGYAAQQALATLRDEPVVGWKIAATSAAGRAHLNIDQPLAGRLYRSIVMTDGAQLVYQHNRMRVAEAEFVLVLGADLAPREEPYSEQEVAGAVAAVCAGLEFPDSRFSNFAAVGQACLLADNACASQFVLGDSTAGSAPTEMQLTQLAGHETRLLVNGATACAGVGGDALGGPLAALTWLANQLTTIGCGLRAGEFVTTGVTGQPYQVGVGDTVTADLGQWGQVSARLV